MSDITSKKILEFCAKQSEVQLPAKTNIIRGETPHEFLYYIIEGCVKMSVTSGSGKTLILHLLFPDNIFPLLHLLPEASHKYDLETLVETRMYKVLSKDFLIFLKNNPDVSYDLNFRLLRGIQGLLQRIENTAFISARQQVASILLYFAKHFSSNISSDAPPSHHAHLQIKITHQEISEWLGLSRENVSIQMKQLERDGLVKTENHFIKINDYEELKKVSNFTAAM